MKRDEDEGRKKATAAEDAELEREVRSRRKFSLAEALGRAGSDLLKGASPATRKRQAEAEMKREVERLLDDPDGALGPVVLRAVTESETLLESGYEGSLPALARWIEQILSSEARLRRLVREADAQWGRIYLEPPVFDRPGSPPEPDDPYTLSSVRAALERLLAGLRAPTASQ